MIANIDGDILLYAVGFASETSFYLCTDGTEFDSAKEATSYCKQHNLQKIKRRDAAPEHVWKGNANAFLRNIQDKTGASELKVFFSAPRNFRQAIYPEYKANRKGMPKPYCYSELKEYVNDRYVCEEQDGYEADDLLGIYQTDDTILCTLDKDLDQITGRHYNWRKDVLYEISAEESEYNLHMQILMGDAVDNIKGLAGIGPKKAAAILDKETTDDYTLVCWLAYKDHRMSAEDFDLVKRLVYIKRDFD